MPGSLPHPGDRILHQLDSLKDGGAAALTRPAAHSPAPFIHATDKVGTTNPIIDEGAYRYECHRNGTKRRKLQ
ncbi:MAG: hypothetical protein ACLP7Q_12975 [Isosphaeraceae bacterium]